MYLLVVRTIYKQVKYPKRIDECNLDLVAILQNIDFNPINVTPVLKTYGTTICTNSLLDDNVNIITSRNNKFKLLTIHERVRHISLTVLKLMDRYGIVP